MPHRDIHIDFNFTFSNLNPKGVDEKEFLEVFPVLKEVKAGIHAMREVGQLPFLSQLFSEDFTLLEKLAKQLTQNYQEVVVVASSAVFAEINMLKHFSTSDKKHRLHHWDSLDFADFNRFFQKIDPKKTLFLLIANPFSKVTQWPKFFFAYDFLQKQLGEEKAKQQLLIMAEEQDAEFRWLAEHLGLKFYALPTPTLQNFAFFSPQVLLPAVFLDFDIQDCVQGAQRMEQRCFLEDLWMNPAAMFAAVVYFLYQKRECREFIHIYHERSALASVDWFSLIWSQCLGHQFDLSGKNKHFGMMQTHFFIEEVFHAGAQFLLEGPHNKIVMFWNQQKQDEDSCLPDIFPGFQSLHYLSGKPFAQISQAQVIAIEQALAEVGVPSLRLNLFGKEAYSLGQLVYLVEVATLFLAGLFNLNPYQTPSIEKVKSYLLGILGDEAYKIFDARVKRQIKDKRYII